MSAPGHIPGRTWHGRKGGPENAFSYGVDYVVVDAEQTDGLPAIFGLNRAAPVSLHDSDHGGQPGRGQGALWVRDVLAAQCPEFRVGAIRLLAQPRVFGHVFNPVAFWLIDDDNGQLAIVIAEVTNTYGDRHSYLCHRDDFGPIGKSDRLSARKIFHVSPFQPIAGEYDFNFDIRDDRISIRIALGHEAGGLIATLTGPVRPLTSVGLLGAMLRRPFGSRRVLGLIHWQALKLWWKGATFRARPSPPAEEISK
jgi:DUF1365 family protein